MIDFIKSVDFSEEMKINDLFNFFKSNSSKINTEIYSKIQKFNKISDFFQYYTNFETRDFLNLLYKIDSLSFEINDEINSSSFNSNIEQYLSCLSRIFLSMKLLQKTKETMNKLFLFYKKIIYELKIEKKIENFNYEDSFSNIDCLTDISHFKLFVNMSRESTYKGSSLDSPMNFIVSDKFMNEEVSDNKDYDGPTPKFNNLTGYHFKENVEIKKEETFEKFMPKGNSIFTLPDIEFIEKKNENLNEEKILKKCESRNFNIKLNKKKSLSVTDIIQINIRNNSENKLKTLNKNNEIKKKSENKLANLLEMINILYRKCLINAEDKIKLKKLIMAKPEKLYDLYNNYYLNTHYDEKILIYKIRKIIE